MLWEDLSHNITNLDDQFKIDMHILNMFSWIPEQTELSKVILIEIYSLGMRVYKIHLDKKVIPLYHEDCRPYYRSIYQPYFFPNIFW